MSASSPSVFGRTADAGRQWEKSFGRLAFVELNEGDFVLDGLKSQDSLLENCRTAYAAAIGKLEERQ